MGQGGNWSAGRHARRSAPRNGRGVNVALKVGGHLSIMRYRIAAFIAVLQMVMFGGHAFLYETWRFFRPLPVPAPPGVTPLGWTVAALSVSFVVASVLAFRYHNAVVRWFYKIAAVWLGAASFFLFAAAAWLGVFCRTW